MSTHLTQGSARKKGKEKKNRKQLNRLKKMTGYISGDSGNATYRLSSLRGSERKKEKRNHLEGGVMDER